MGNDGDEAGYIKNCQNIVTQILHNTVYDDIKHADITQQAEEHNREGKQDDRVEYRFETVIHKSLNIL